MRKSITKEEISELPLYSYGGKTIIAADSESIDHALEEILGHPVIGFDTESKPVFKRGHFNHVALIQIAIPGKVFLLRTIHAGLSDKMIQLFESKDIQKIGISLIDDLSAMKKRRHFRPDGFVDLNKVAERLNFKNIGARNLTAMVLGVRISKNQQRSNWENQLLTDSQIRYAATDAWICLEIYQKFMKEGLLELLTK